MKKNWFAQKVRQYSEIAGYVKPKSTNITLKLDTNENFVIPRNFQDEILHHFNTDVREYPLGKTEELIVSLCKYLKVPQSMIGIGNGSDQILDLILANFASKKTKMLVSDPTFTLIEQRSKLYGIPTIKIPFSKNMTLDITKFIAKSKNADILYLDMPNNPTGFQFLKHELEELVKNFSGLVIIDAAYGEFSDYSVVHWTKKFDNLIVVQTFSKSFGLAGLRLGYFIANKTFTETFNRIIQHPYPVNTIAIQAGITALKNIVQVKKSIETIKQERNRIIENLKKYDAFDVFDSNANFVLFDAHGADKRVHTALIEQGISIKKLGKIGRHIGCLRVTVGTSEMNSKFLLAIRDLFE